MKYHSSEADSTGTPKRIPLAYICGPFRGPDAWTVAENVRNAERVALDVAKLGYMPLCPHTNTAHFDGVEGVTGDFWLEGNKELMRRCDLVVLIPGWERSSGSLAEIDEAIERGMPVGSVASSVTLYPEALDVTAFLSASQREAKFHPVAHNLRSMEVSHVLEVWTEAARTAFRADYASYLELKKDNPALRFEDTCVAPSWKFSRYGVAFVANTP